MDIFQGILPPELPVKFDDSNIMDYHTKISKTLHEIFNKAKRFKGDSGTVSMVSNLRFNATVLEKKTITLTIVDGIITTVGTESDWTTVV